MPQMFKVEDSERKVIMIAPLETITKVFRLTNQQQARLAKETVELSGVCTLAVSPDSDTFSNWEHINIHRLPLEIPSRSPQFKETR